jgi:hypothetical protein
MISKIKYLFLLATLIFWACKSNSIDDPQLLKGRWVEGSGRGDTLVFDAVNTNRLDIKRGFEIKNGSRIPKSGSGIWEYRLIENYQMEVRDLLLQRTTPTISHAELKKDDLYISNFYEYETNKYELRVFVRR